MFFFCLPLNLSLHFAGPTIYPFLNISHLEYVVRVARDTRLTFDAKRKEWYRRENTNRQKKMKCIRHFFFHWNSIECHDVAGN